MLKRIRSVTVAATFLTAAFIAGPAAAQAPLGFSIDPHQGFPGDVVNGMVDTDDIAANCFTTEQQVRAAFSDVYQQLGTEESFQMYWPDYPNVDLIPTQNYEQLAYAYLFLITLGVQINQGGAAQTFLDTSHVLTFADLATQQPVGELSTFDQNTGLGSVIVPNVDPGLWAVAAACVEPDINNLSAAIDVIAPILEADGRSFALDEADTFDYLTAHAVEFLEPFVSIRALGLQLFTVLAELGHFQCYRAHPTDMDSSTIPVTVPVTVADRFGVYSGTAHRPIDLCAPADKNGEDPGAADSPDFLASYKLSVPGSMEPMVDTVQATNQFGSISLDVLKPDSLLVPTVASLDEPPAPDGGFLNHFTCYSVHPTNRGGAPSPVSVTVQTAFETVEVEAGTPERLCVPASKNDEPVIPSGPENLLCYDVKGGPGLKPEPDVFIANQFGQETERIGQRRELCLPTDLTE